MDDDMDDDVEQDFYTIDDPPPVNLREWLNQRGLVIASQGRAHYAHGDDDEEEPDYDLEPLSDLETDKLACQFATAEMDELIRRGRVTKEHPLHGLIVVDPANRYEEPLPVSASGPCVNHGDPSHPRCMSHGCCVGHRATECRAVRCGN